ncbi:hypothetical protein ACQPZF_38030 [Actinosynnema sp. CS-041913]|uniref:hypothetical protein n=1 Tax=Actinosynnema sp. CS-041913 TaxID=3239917 RepID=UPI003D923539
MRLILLSEHPTALATSAQLSPLANRNARNSAETRRCRTEAPLRVMTESVPPCHRGKKGVSPEGAHCATGTQASTVFRMEQTWKITGVYADWHLTVAILPPDNDNPAQPLPNPNLDALAEHFRTLMEVAESHRELDRLTAQGVR